jgi:hypothetical protein
MSHLFRETEMSIGRAARDAEVSIATMRRWILKGRRGVRLESYIRGGRRFTTREALHRFYCAVTAAADASRPTTDTDTQEIAQRAEQAGNTLDRYVFGRKPRNRRRSRSR